MSYKGNNIQGWMTDKELQWLYEQASHMDSIVEIGSWKGRSTHALLSGCKGIVTAVDHFKGSLAELETTHLEAKDSDIHAEFLSNVGSFDNLKVIKTDSLSASLRFGNYSVDMVFIDGDHTISGIMVDLLMWLPIAKKLICGHDWNFVAPTLSILQKRYPGSFWESFDISKGRQVDGIWSFEL